jgi:hypothetical protein
MATTTPNFGWSVPTSTDLVKDGATAIETLGDSIDASLVDLKGGTTGQVLAKNSNTDMDFVWSADASGIPASAFTAKGNLLVGTGTSTYTAQAVGANGTVLTADSAEADGVKWATVPSGGMTLLASGTLSGTSVSLTSISQDYENLIIFVRDFRNSGGNNDFILQANSTGFALAIEFQNAAGTYQVQPQAGHYVTFNTPTVDTDAHAYIVIPDYTAASVQLAQSWAYVRANNTTNTHRYVTSAASGITSAITSVQLNSPSTWGGGTYELWGQK